MRRYLSCFILWLMMLALLSRYALAATLQVAPVTLDLQSDQRAAAIYLTNSGKAAILRRFGCTNGRKKTVKMFWWPPGRWSAARR